MFDIGFWELALIAVIGIVIVGPERLPEVVRSVMLVVRKIQRMFSDVRGDIERELNLDEVRRSVEELDLQEHIRKLNQSVIDADKEVRSEGKKLLQEIDNEMKTVEKSPQEFSDERLIDDAIEKNERMTQYEAPHPESERDTGIEHIDSPNTEHLTSASAMLEKNHANSNTP